MSALRLLALSYLASASVFVVTATLVAHPQLARNAAGNARALAQVMDEKVWQPLTGRDYPSAVVRLTLAPPGPNDVQTPAQAPITPPTPRTVEQAELTNSDASAVIAILPDLPQPPEPAQPRMRNAPDIDIARNDVARAAPSFRIPDPPSDAPATDRGAAVARRLRTSLTPEMVQNFDLFLYVSTAARGALAQRLYVFEKQPSGELKLAHYWAASTGREQNEISPAGRRAFTATPRGYYELDPARMYRSYHSVSWHQDMPSAMFFNWEREGLQTGLAIHAATGDDIGRLGRRASAGCVHLLPQNAAALYDLIRTHYRGPVPRFAYDTGTQTMSNRGAFMHDRAGNLKMADGYRVLVTIENYAGDADVAELF
jgi:hypothetical protein